MKQQSNEPAKHFDKPAYQAGKDMQKFTIRLAVAILIFLLISILLFNTKRQLQIDLTLSFLYYVQCMLR